MYRNHIEDLNYYGDERNTKPGEIPAGFPTKYEVCPVCNGKGTHVNPSIDAGGLTYEDFDQDPEFYHDYMSGMYDVTCNHCEGRTTILVVDRDRLTDAQREELEEIEQDAREDRALYLAEMRAGA